MVNWFKNLDEEFKIGLILMFIPAVVVFTIGLAVTLLKIIWAVLGL